MVLLEIGFWCQAHDDQDEGGATAEDELPHRANPLSLVDDAWFAANAPLVRKLRWYLTEGAFVESHELAYSYCRFSGCAVAERDPKVMGACTMTDGVYCWPEAYWHYVACHHVKPPRRFLQHVEANSDKMQDCCAAKSDGSVLLLWDAFEQQAVPMPRAMQEWITAHTTIRVREHC